MPARHITRAAAIILLLMVCVDLAVPSLCAAESVPVFGPPQQVGWSPVSSDPAAPVAPVLGEEDCFCCCSHIKPAAKVLVTAGFAVAEESPAQTPQLAPLQLATLIFHPPKQ